MRVLIVDDEPLAQTALANILSARRDVDSCECAGDAVEALEKIEKNPYDVVLLDINMPELSGIELLDRLKERGQAVPAVVFVTAHNEHAVAAFERRAADYVLKPFSSERIGEALNIAFRRGADERAARLVEALKHLPVPPERKNSRIAIKAKGRILFIDPADILAVEAEGNYVLLQRESGSYLLRESISTMAEKLKAYGFIRIHRSVLVNGSYVEEIQPWVTGEYGLRIKGGKQYTVTRTYKRNLRSLAEFWIGAESFIAD